MPFLFKFIYGYNPSISSFLWLTVYTQTLFYMYVNWRIYLVNLHEFMFSVMAAPLCFRHPTPPCCPLTHSGHFDCYLFGKYHIGIFFPATVLTTTATGNVKKVAFADFQDVAMSESSTWKCKQSTINVVRETPKLRAGILSAIKSSLIHVCVCGCLKDGALVLLLQFMRPTVFLFSYLLFICASTYVYIYVYACIYVNICVNACVLSLFAFFWLLPEF